MNTDEPISLDHHAVLEAVPSLTYRRLDEWTRNGHLKVRQSPSDIPGVQRFWDADDILVLRRVVELVAVGMQPGPAFYVARHGNPVQLGDYALLQWVGALR